VAVAAEVNGPCSRRGFGQRLVNGHGEVGSMLARGDDGIVDGSAMNSGMKLPFTPTNASTLGCLMLAVPKGRARSGRLVHANTGPRMRRGFFAQRHHCKRDGCEDLIPSVETSNKPGSIAVSGISPHGRRIEGTGTRGTPPCRTGGG
jgi:hypothetical protein